MPHAVQVAKSELRQKLLMCSPGLLWLAIMFVKPHKVTCLPHAHSAGNPKLSRETSRDVLVQADFGPQLVDVSIELFRCCASNSADSLAFFSCPQSGPFPRLWIYLMPRHIAQAKLYSNYYFESQIHRKSISITCK